MLGEGIGVPRTSKRKRAAVTTLYNYSGIEEEKIETCMLFLYVFDYSSY